MQALREVRTAGEVLGASLFVPVPAERLYETVLDVRSFPAWAAGVRRVEVLSGDGEAGMVSEWEVSLLGFGRRVRSVLEEAESPALLCWSYEGPVSGWGRCVMKDWGGGALAEFTTELRPAEPILERLMRAAVARDAAYGQLKRCLARLGRVASGDGPGVRVGPLLEAA